MSSIQINPDDLEAAAAAFPADTPLFMLNLLRFHPQAQYTSASDGEPCSGQDAYLTRYLPAFNTAVQPYGGSELVFAGIVIARVVGPVDDSWDAVGVARYPSISSFQHLVNDPGYQTTAEPHRRAALADWRLYATTALG
ncbi:hypothetical protein [Actinoplanes sp. NBRC 103695]|uniref:hypothetical protein n=1 Tax=Actinoplanes sp. NBRC 103695 TaxID=3032202 RepID=UPI0024A3FE56|nr:hypothetical protein [Actinoplanes sp. NBRC 103695]GLY98315.1 DUF1330 domain-containing protein [Actinoplanes sp. NBRC 103695]